MAPAAGLSPSSPSSAALAWVPGLETGQKPAGLERLSGGQVNEIWRVDTSQGRFTLRIDGPATRRPGVDRQLERLLHTAAAAAGLAPRIVSAVPGLEVRVCEFLAGRTWTVADFQDATSIVRLGERLATLHQLALPAHCAPRFDPCALAGRYLQQARADDVAHTGAEPVLLQLRRSMAVTEAAALPPCIVHGDLPNGNVLENTQLWLLDWEYAQLADPIYDIACILAQVPLATRLQRLLLDSSGLGGPKNAQRLPDAVFVYRALGWAWHLARAEACAPPSFG